MAKSWEVRFPIGIPFLLAIFPLSLFFSRKFRFFFVTVYKLFQEPRHLLVFYSLLKKKNENIVIYTIEEFLHITFEGIAWSRVIFTCFCEHIRDSFYSFVTSFSYTTGKRIRDECFFKYGVKNLKNCMMYNSISNNCFMYMSSFWIADEKTLIRCMPVRLIRKFSLKFEYLYFQISFKKSNIWSRPFTVLEFVPS